MGLIFFKDSVIWFAFAVENLYLYFVVSFHFFRAKRFTFTRAIFNMATKRMLYKPAQANAGKKRNR